MKALVVADDEKAINNISQVLKSAGYDPIVYKWLLKALDNIEEISPHLIVISTRNYPRHWKTLAQYATNSFGNYTPQVILYIDENFTEEEQKKAEALKVRGCFDSVEVEGLDKLREILSKTDDIFSGYLTDEEQEEITVEDLIPNAKKYVVTAVDDSRNGNIEEELPSDSTELEDSVESEPEIFEAEEIKEQAELTESEVEEQTESTESEQKEIFSDNEIEDKSDTTTEFSEIEPEEIVSDSEINDEIPTVSKIIEDSSNEDFSPLPESEELEQLLENDYLETEETKTNGVNEMDNEQSIDDKLAEIMNANKADAKAKAEELNIDTIGESAVSFVFTNPITLAMVSGIARNYNGMTLEFTPDIPSFIMNLDAGTKISIASLKHNENIENVSAEVMSNDSNKLYLTIKKFN